jgi:hypothetical protein
LVVVVVVVFVEVGGVGWEAGVVGVGGWVVWT